MVPEKEFTLYVLLRKDHLFNSQANSLLKLLYRSIFPLGYQLCHTWSKIKKFKESFESWQIPLSWLLYVFEVNKFINRSGYQHIQVIGIELFSRDSQNYITAIH